MSNRQRPRQVPPGPEARDQIRAALRCWSCAAEPELTHHPRRGLSATVEHLPDCPQVPADHAAAGRLVHTVSPVVWKVGA